MLIPCLVSQATSQGNESPAFHLHQGSIGSLIRSNISIPLLPIERKGERDGERETERETEGERRRERDGGREREGRREGEGEEEGEGKGEGEREE